MPLNAYKKNWRYGDGGRIYATKSRLIDNGSFPSADKKSRIHLYDTFVDEIPAKIDKKVYVDNTVDAQERDQANPSAPSIEVEESTIIRHVDASVWKAVDLSRRGANLAD